MQARLQHAAALELIRNQRAGEVDAAKEWRSIVKMPKFANSVEGALALQRLGADRTQRDEVSRLLAKEYVVWQLTRAREKADALLRLVEDGRATPALIYARSSEIQVLSDLPDSLLKLAIDLRFPKTSRASVTAKRCSRQPHENSEAVSKRTAAWRSLEAGYPNLLTPEDVERRERIVLKLLRLIPRNINPACAMARLRYRSNIGKRRASRL